MENEPLERRFNVAVQHITNRILPCGFDVSPHAPSTLEGITGHYRRTGRVCVWDGASDKTIFACPETNYAFRAWHDTKHIIFGYEFNRIGEVKVCYKQMEDICAIYNGYWAMLFCAILRAEIIGQFDYKERNGGFPVDQMEFVRSYLKYGENALKMDFGVC